MRLPDPRSASWPWRIFIGAFALRGVALFIWGNIGRPQLWEHGMIAARIVAGQGYSLNWPLGAGEIVVPSAYMPPGYVAFITPFLWLFGETRSAFLLILVVQALLSAIAAVFAYRLALRIFPAHAAVAAGLLCAAYPPFLYAAADFGTTTLYCAVLGGFLLLLLRFSDRPRPLAAIWAGLAGALLALVRGEGLLIAGALSLWLLLRTRYALFIPLGVALGLAPWFIRNAAVFDAAVPVTTSFGFNFWRGHNDIATGTGREDSGAGIWGSDSIDAGLSHVGPSARYELDRDRVFLRDALTFVRRHPAREAWLAVRKVFYLWILDTTHPLARTPAYAASWGSLLVLALLGLREPGGSAFPASLLLVFAAGMTMTAVLFFVLPRYQIVLAYGILPFAGAGAMRIARMLRSKRGDGLISQTLTP